MDSANPYAPPTSDLETPPLSVARPFHSIGTQKLILMALATLGIYFLYYFYKQWQRYREFARLSIWPAVRAYFFQIMSFSFFRYVADEARVRGIPFRWNPGAMASIVFFAPIIGRFLPLPFGPILSLGSLVPIFLVNDTVLEINTKVDPYTQPDERFTVWNWSALALGALIWAYGLYLILHVGFETADA